MWWAWHHHLQALPQRLVVNPQASFRPQETVEAAQQRHVAPLHALDLGHGQTKLWI